MLMNSARLFDNGAGQSIFQSNGAFGRKHVVASGVGTPQAVLRKLATDSDHTVRRCLAANSNTPIDVQTKLLCDQHADVRLGLAENRAPAPGILETLVQDTSLTVRYALADNPCLPIEIYLLLANDKHPYVAKRAVANLKRIARMTREELIRAIRLHSRFGNQERAGQSSSFPGIKSGNTDKVQVIASGHDVA